MEGGSGAQPAGRPAVVLLSGGLDSATCLAIAREKTYRTHALTVVYGQRHARETEAARRVAAHLGAAAHVILPVDPGVFRGSALTDAGPVPKGRDPRAMAAEIPATYVPARNTVFLALALAWAESLGTGDIFLGVNAVDYSGYPDCRPEYVDAFERMANLATRAAVEGRVRVRIHAPLLRLTKAEIIRKGTELGVDYGLTWSCYDPDPQGRPCGACDSCRLRAGGFRAAGLTDPLLGAVR
jgi:7-cyano-7-deazaguanine synthase